MSEKREAADNNKWYREHKDDPEVRDAFRAAAKRYYEKNREYHKTYVLKKYYEKKDMEMPAVRRAYIRKNTTPAETEVKN